MKVIWSLPSILFLVLTMFFIRNCESSVPSGLEYDSDGEKLVLQADEVPPGWTLDYSDNVSRFKGAKQWRNQYRVTNSMTTSDLSLRLRILSSSVSIFENEAEATTFWEIFNADVEQSAEESCFTSGKDYGYKSNLADQYIIWCHSVTGLIGQEAYEHVFVARYKNVVTTLAATILQGESMPPEEAAQLGSLRWQDAERLLKLTDDKIRQAMNEP